MAIFDRQYMKDMRAILDKASVLKVEPKQNVVKEREIDFPEDGKDRFGFVHSSLVVDGDQLADALAAAYADLEYMRNSMAVDRAKVEPKQSIEPVKVEAVAPSNQATNAVNCYQQTLQQLANRRDGLGNYNQLANLNNQRAAGLNSGRTLLDLYSGSQIGINR